MAKRGWTQVDNGVDKAQSPTSSLSRDQGDVLSEHLVPDGAQKRARPETQGPDSETVSNEEQRAMREGGAFALQQKIPVISRKVKACATCRKQKVRCFNDGGSRCRRCTDKDLTCVLDKSLQMLINERIPSNDALLQDVEMVYNNVQTILRQLNLPAQAPLQSVKYSAFTPVSAEANDAFSNEAFPPDDPGPSCDNSPKMSPTYERDLPRVPIQSVYHLTKLSAFRSPEASQDDIYARHAAQDQQGSRPDDFISKGLLHVPDAERLFRLYNDRLDNYFYNVGARYPDLATLREGSPILTAAILTVAAMHDPLSNNIYPICNREFRRLMTDSLFDRQIDRDHLRALCVASYWLNDSSWMTSGIAARRRVVFDVGSQFKKAVENNDPEAADFIKIWYLVYICDQHLSTLYGRVCTTKDDVAIREWESLAKAPNTTTGDLRLLSQVALLSIIHEVRELFASFEADRPIPAVFVTQIKAFARQLDQWLGYWGTLFPEYQENFGHFPRKGAQLHFQFAKLYLYSHVFRGVRESFIPTIFLEAAHGAVSAALAILDMIITDADVKDALIGLPCYIQSMIGFACMFLARLSTLHGDTMVERAVVIDRITKIAIIYRQTPVGKWHLIPLMADGLDKIVSALGRIPGPAVSQGSSYSNTTPLCDTFGFNQDIMSMVNLDPQYLLDSNMNDLGASQLQFFSMNPSDPGTSMQPGSFS